MSSIRKKRLLPREMTLPLVAAILAVVVFVLLFIILDPNPSPAGRSYDGTRYSESPLGDSNPSPTESLAPYGREIPTVTPKAPDEQPIIESSPIPAPIAPVAPAPEPQPASPGEPEPVTPEPEAPAPVPTPAPQPTRPALCGPIILTLVCEILLP